MNNHVAFYYDPENKEQLRAAATYFATLAGAKIWGLAEETKEVETPEPVKAEKVETPKAEEPKSQKVKEEEPQAEAEKAEEEEKPKKKKAATKKKAAPKKKEELKEEVEEAEEAEITLDELRQALSPKVKTHKEELRAKMRELGAKNISTLEESKYGEFYSFIKTLD